MNFGEEISEIGSQNYYSFSMLAKGADGGSWPRLCEKTVGYDSLTESAGGRMARFVEGMDRGQATLLPECLED
jgi:hypothetical protein